MLPLLLIALSCAPTPPDPALVARREALRTAMAFPGAAGELDPSWGASAPVTSGQARAVSYQVRPGFRAAALLIAPEGQTPLAAVVAHGHYGEGKNSPEAQDIAIALVSAGVAALVVDTPGVEEWEVPGRQIHFEGGAHNRALLAAAGTSALALQIAALTRGLDLLEEQGYRRFVATGASGGATQSFYLSLADRRVEGLMLASMPPVPREARPSGCACDVLPGWPGPDLGVLEAVDRPLLWMSEVQMPRPEGLPKDADFRVIEGPHSYTAPMVAAALSWLKGTLGWPLRSEDPPGPVAPLGLRTPGPAAGPWLRIQDLTLQPSAMWTPTRREGPPMTAACEGQGRVVLVAGGDAEDVGALKAAGLRPCVATLLDEDQSGQEEAIARQQPWADALGGSLAALAGQTGAEAVWGGRAWGLAASASGLPFVVRDPVLRLDQVDPEKDPAWIHVPGAWWGGAPSALAGALAQGDDRAALIGSILNISNLNDH